MGNPNPMEMPPLTGGVNSAFLTPNIQRYGQQPPREAHGYGPPFMMHPGRDGGDFDHHDMYEQQDHDSGPDLVARIGPDQFDDSPRRNRPLQ